MNIQKFLITIVCFVFCLNINAQTVKKGDLTIQAGIGLLSTYFLDASETIVPPVQASVSYRFMDMLSVGAFAGYSEYNSTPQHHYDGAINQYHSTSILGGVRAAAHATKIHNWDVYGGFQLGYSKPTITNNILVSSERRLPESKVREEFVYSGFIGATGYITDKVGIYGEMGYGISLFNAGVSIKL